MSPDDMQNTARSSPIPPPPQTFEPPSTFHDPMQTKLPPNWPTRDSGNRLNRPPRALTSEYQKSWLSRAKK